MKIALAGCRFSLCAVLSVGLFVQTAAAQDPSGYMTIAPSSSGFGSGPMTVSLIGSARMMAPLRGEEATNPSRDMDIARPVDAAPFGTTVGTSKALVAERAKVSPAETGKDVAFAR